ncbi:hypothetical protein BDV93DRAFT_493112 [Ceratobasidium sp. AG-I]|nr:hypothetical protein BDV93DRAFT_493112 [Ceratobasidium sp. AG-I]
MFVKAIVISALASVAFATECARTYTVQAGDWCDTISQAHNSSTYQLSTVNADKINDSCTNLEVGQVLCLGTKGEDCNVTHTVVAGDSCDKIMMGAAINDTILYANNPQIDEYCSNIYIGEVLCVANAIASPSEVAGRHVGSAGGVPAGPPAPVAYPAAKNRKTKTASSVAPTETGTVAVQFTQSATATYAAAAATASSTPDDDEDCEDDEDELPECEDPNDDGYW